MFNKLKYLALALFIIPCTFLFVACGSKAVTLEANHIELSVSEYVYDGNAKKPEVTIVIDGKEIDQENYVVTYENNTDAGVATVVVTANPDSDEIKGSARKDFVIKPATYTEEAQVKSVSTINSLLADSNYNEVIIKKAVLSIDEDLIVPANKTLIFENPAVLMRGGNVSGDGVIKSYVDSPIYLSYAVQFSDYVFLTENISGLFGSAIVLGLPQNNIECVIDLNGHSIESGFEIGNYDDEDEVFVDYSMDLTICNSSTDEETYIGTAQSDYGIAVFANEKVTINLDNVNLLGKNYSFVTNGSNIYQDAEIFAENCSFGSNKTTIGAFLPANYNYSFENCDFVGLSAYYAKSGTHSLVGCDFTGVKETYSEPQYNSNGAYTTGSALIIDSSNGYVQTLDVTVDGGKFSSLNGYGIEVCATGDIASYSELEIIGEPDFTDCELGDSNK